MHNFHVTRFAALAMVLVGFASTAAQAAGMHDLAPADEYFGRMRMSVLGIRNELDGLERRAMSGDRNVAAMSGKLALVDDAMSDWRARYPRDTWLPRFEAKRMRVAALIGVGARSSRYEPSADTLVRVLGALRH
jgi:hypothetical protein